MKKIRMLGLSVVLLTMLVGVTMWAAGKSATVKGYVIDSSCTFSKNLKKPISPDCAVACARGSSEWRFRGSRCCAVPS